MPPELPVNSQNRKTLCENRWSNRRGSHGAESERIFLLLHWRGHPPDSRPHLAVAVARHRARIRFQAKAELSCGIPPDAGTRSTRKGRHGLEVCRREGRHRASGYAVSLHEKRVPSAFGGLTIGRAVIWQPPAMKNRRAGEAQHVGVS